MSAGTGVIHSEFNGSPKQPVHFLQIWIEPAVMDVEPSYQQFAYDPAEKKGRLRLIAGPDKKTLYIVARGAEGTGDERWARSIYKVSMVAKGYTGRAK